MVGAGGTHRWVPVSAAYIEREERTLLGYAVVTPHVLVVEVCQSCRQYVEVAYTRWHPTPENDG